MKQKRLVSMVGALVVILGAVVLITGCPQANSNNGKKDNTTINNGGNSGGSTGGSTGSNTGNGGSSTTTQGRAVYVAKIENNGVTYTYTITFKTDGTWMQRTVGESLDVVIAQGTYTGDASKDGTITLTIKKTYNGTTLVDYTGTDATKSATISGGTFTLLGVKYTRQ